jgi:hypothetical protein
MPYQTVTIVTSSAATQSAPVILDWRNGAPTTAIMYASTVAASSGPFSLQFTLDDPNLIGGSSLAKWSTLSSQGFTAYSSGATPLVHSASAIAISEGVMYTILTPVAALRLSSTTGITGAATLKVIQGEL